MCTCTKRCFRGVNKSVVGAIISLQKKNKKKEFKSGLVDNIVAIHQNNCVHVRFWPHMSDWAFSRLLQQSVKSEIKRFPFTKSDMSFFLVIVCLLESVQMDAYKRLC